MFRYFQTNVKKVKKDGVLIDNAVVVSCVCDETTNCIEIPSKYLGCYIVGLMYDAETQEFYQVEEVTEPTQLDTIEANTSYLVMMSE